MNTANSILSSVSAIADMQDKINDIVNPPALRQMQRNQELISKMINPPAIQALQEQQKAIEAMTAPVSALTRSLKDFSTTITPLVGYAQDMQKTIAAVMPAMQFKSTATAVDELHSIFSNNVYLKEINVVNKALQSVAVFDAIPSLRNALPFCFSYEHGEGKAYDEEIYPKLLDEEACSVELKEATLEVSFKVGTLEVEGQFVKDVVSLKYLFPDITKSELYNFIRFLKKYPFMAMAKQSGAGWKIFNSLKEKATEHCIVVNEGTILYRARKLDGKETFLKDEEMLEPDTGIPNIGRFNPYGVALLYVSESSETAKAELEGDDVQIAKLIVNRPLRCIDLEKSGGLVYDFCKKPLSSDNTDWNPSEYILPNFLGQCGYYLKGECGINLDGFKYESTKHTGNYCYVLFEVHQPDVKIVDICCNL